jgi:beta-lactamase class A
MNKKGLIILVLAISVALNLVFGYLFIRDQKEEAAIAKANKVVNQVSEKYPFIARRVALENPNTNDAIINFLSLRNQLESTVKPWEIDFSFYFEYLPTGTSVAVNSNSPFYAASLFKVPVIMAYYHYLERTGISRNQDLVIGKDDLDSQFGNLWKKGAGFKISDMDAIKLALERSDNTAAKVIANQVEQQDFDDVYRALDLDLLTGNGGALMTTREYGVILKALYFSAILNKDDSSEILKFLSNTPFNDKLVAGVPKDVIVAHKIGDYNDSKGKKAFYDCGIVYLPKRPYMLCMSSVSDESTANVRMKQISQAVYDYVSNAK